MTTHHVDLLPNLAAYVAAIQTEQALILNERKAELEQLARFIRDARDTGAKARVTFICTHNSRRSQLAQVWAGTAAHLLGIERFEAYSGGTEATAFNPRAVAALRRAGFSIEITKAGENPVYGVRFSPAIEPIICFSKTFDQPPNPGDGFCAVMTCSAADAGCPVVLGASERISLRYEDPKNFDGADRETAKYDERCRQIASEIIYSFSLAAAR